MAGAHSFAGFAGAAAGALLKQSRSAWDDGGRSDGGRGEGGGRPDGGAHDYSSSSLAHTQVHAPHAPAARRLESLSSLRQATSIASTHTATHVHRPSDKFVAAPSRYMHKDAQRYAELALVEDAAEWLSAQKGRNGTMPSDVDFRAAGMCGVADAIQRIHGGADAVALRLGMQLHYTNACAAIGMGYTARDAAYWNTFGHVQQAVLELAQALCAPDTMPSYMALRSAGLGGVADAIRAKHGGLSKVAERLGLQLPPAFSG